MPAEIYDNDTMMYARAGGTPWHKMGVAVDHAPTSEQAIKVAGLDWSVLKRPAIAPALDGHGIMTSPDLFSLQRSDTGYILASGVTEQYEPFANAEGFSFLDSLVQDGVITYETAGSLRNGRTVFLLARITEDMRIAGETWKQYMLLRLGHDGGSAVSGKPTSVRVVCANTLDAAFAEKGSGSFSIRHTSGMRDRLDEARRVFEITTGAQRRMAEFLNRAALTPVTPEMLAAVEADLFGEPDQRGPRVKSKAAQFKRIVLQEVQRNGQTAYSVINGITGYTDHIRSGKPGANEERRFDATQFGGGVDVKRSAIGVLAKATGLVLASR